MCERKLASSSQPSDPFDHLLSKAELRRTKAARAEFLRLDRLPITVVLDRVRRNYNLGALFRLCDAMRVELLVIGGTDVDVRKRKLVQAARGTHKWVPWTQIECAATIVSDEKDRGAQIVVAELTGHGVSPERLATSFPVCLVLVSEIDGVSKGIIDMADAVVTIPMLGMANSINVASAAAIVLYRLTTLLQQG